MNLAKRDRAVIWHPYTQMKGALPHIPIVKGAGVFVTDENGKEYLDAVSSWWVNIHGHANRYIAGRVSEQLNTLEHVIFAGFTHEPAITLAERLLKILPGKQSKIFYSDNGSTAVEVAIKMCLQYWLNEGKPRRKIIAFKNAYHGDTFGAMSVSGRSVFTNAFNELLFEVEFIDLPTRENISRLQEQFVTSKEDIACFIFEPLVQGSAGMLMYEPAMLDALLQTCNEHNILAIADEVMTGFGRTGSYFACDQLSALPDLVCLSKGLTGGTMAMGVTSCNERIYNAFLSEDKTKTLYHGHSYTANPLSCAAANASLDLFLANECLDNIKNIERQHARFLTELTGHPKLRDVRQTGTILALEWATTGGTSYLNGLRDQLYTFFIERGIIIRPLGNIIYIMPPYIITEEELESIYHAIREALKKF